MNNKFWICLILQPKSKNINTILREEESEWVSGGVDSVSIVREEVGEWRGRQCVSIVREEVGEWE